MSFLKLYDTRATEKIENLFNQVEKNTYKLPRENLEAMQSVPLKKGVNKGALTYTYKIINELGMAKIIAADARDLPPVSRGIKMKTVEIKDIGDSYSFNQKEIDAWLFAGQSIDTGDADTARRKIDEKVDEIILNGDNENGLYGLLSNPNVPVITLAPHTSGGSDTEWNGGKSIDEIKTDIQALIDTVFDNTKGARGGQTVIPDTIKIPRSAFVFLSTKRVSNDTKETWLESLKTLFAPQGIVNWECCNSASGSGVGGKDRIMLYKRSEENLYSIVSEPFRILPAQYNGMIVTYNCFARTAGVVFRRPLTAVYADGV